MFSSLGFVLMVVLLPSPLSLSLFLCLSVRTPSHRGGDGGVEGLRGHGRAGVNRGAEARAAAFVVPLPYSISLAFHAHARREGKKEGKPKVTKGGNEKEKQKDK